MESRKDLWESLCKFREIWITSGKNVTRIEGANYQNKSCVLNNFILENRINLNGSGFRNNKQSFIGEMGCYVSHYNCWKYVVDNNFDSCLILEDGIEIVGEKSAELLENLTIDENDDILFVNEEMKRDFQGNFIGYGTQGYIVTKSGAQKLLELCYTLSMPIDLQIRNLCNLKKISAGVFSSSLVRRNNNRISSIDNFQSNAEDLNEKQNPNTLIQRILMNLLEKKINIDDFI